MKIREIGYGVSFEGRCKYHKKIYYVAPYLKIEYHQNGEGLKILYKTEDTFIADYGFFWNPMYVIWLVHDFLEGIDAEKRKRNLVLKFYHIDVGGYAGFPSIQDEKYGNGDKLVIYTKKDLSNGDIAAVESYVKDLREMYLKSIEYDFDDFDYYFEVKRL